jgi:hypothetical protein
MVAALLFLIVVSGWGVKAYKLYYHAASRVNESNGPTASRYVNGHDSLPETIQPSQIGSLSIE